MQLYDLAGQDPDVRFSPFCWRAKMALRHKALDVEILPWRFTEKGRIEQTGQGQVPVLVHEGRWIHDSWQIACYLDRTYPDRPMLMATAGEQAAARFVRFWADQTLHAALRPMILLAVHDAAAAEDQPYFRESREARFGIPLEQACTDREGARRALHQVLAPVESTLGEVDWLAGDAPGFADYIVFGSLQWANVVSPEDLLPQDGALRRWFERMLDLFDGYARGASTVQSAKRA